MSNIELRLVFFSNVIKFPELKSLSSSPLSPLFDKQTLFSSVDRLAVKCYVVYLH